MDAERYWMVHSPINRDAKVKHTSKSSAQVEARRLAAQHIGETFFVLEAVDAYAVEIPEPRSVYLMYPAPEPEEAAA